MKPVGNRKSYRLITVLLSFPLAAWLSGLPAAATGEDAKPDSKPSQAATKTTKGKKKAPAEKVEAPLTAHWKGTRSAPISSTCQPPAVQGGSPGPVNTLEDIYVATEASGEILPAAPAEPPPKRN